MNASMIHEVKKVLMTFILVLGVQANNKIKVDLSMGWRGVVMVKIDESDQVGTVCNNGWNNVQCQVICRELKYGGGRMLKNVFKVHDFTSKKIIVNSVRCTGSEKSLSMCSYNTNKSNNCYTQVNQAGCECNQPSDLLIRDVLEPTEVYLDPTLTDGEYNVVKMRRYGNVGFIHDNWGNSECRVVCRNKGQCDGESKPNNLLQFYDDPALQKWLVHYQCNGNEMNLDECKRRFNPVTSHDKPVQCKCTNSCSLNGTDDTTNSSHNDVYSHIILLVIIILLILFIIMCGIFGFCVYYHKEIQLKESLKSACKGVYSKLYKPGYSSQSHSDSEYLSMEEMNRSKNYECENITKETGDVNTRLEIVSTTDVSLNVRKDASIDQRVESSFCGEQSTVYVPEEKYNDTMLKQNRIEILEITLDKDLHERNSNAKERPHCTTDEVVENTCINNEACRESGSNQSSMDSSLPSQKYSLPDQGRATGLALLINNMEGPNFKRRHWSKSDQDNLRWIWTKLGFYVIPKENCDYQGIEDLITEVKCLIKKQKYKCFICCVLSHGINGYFQTICGKMYRIDKLLWEFSDEGLPCFKDCPKIFFFETCREYPTAAHFEGNSPPSLPFFPNLLGESCKAYRYRKKCNEDAGVELPGMNFFVKYATSEGCIARASETDQGACSNYTQEFYRFFEPKIRRKNMKDLKTEMKKFIKWFAKFHAVYQDPEFYSTLLKRLELLDN